MTIRYDYPEAEIVLSKDFRGNPLSTRLFVVLWKFNVDVVDTPLKRTLWARFGMFPSNRMLLSESIVDVG